MRFLRLLHAAALTVSLLGFVAYVACIGTPVAQAQAISGEITGDVTDANGAVIVSAKVAAKNVATGVSSDALDKPNRSLSAQQPATRHCMTSQSRPKGLPQRYSRDSGLN